MADEKKIPDEKKVSSIDALKKFQFIPVTAEYANQELTFKALGFTDTMEFLSLFMNNPNDFLKENERKAKEYIAKSTGIEMKELEKAPAGFVAFGLNHLLEAIDFDFFLQSSNELTVKMENLMKKYGISQDLLEGSPASKAGQSNTSQKS